MGKNEKTKELFKEIAPYHNSCHSSREGKDEIIISPKYLGQFLPSLPSLITNKSSLIITTILLILKAACISWAVFYFIYKLTNWIKRKEQNMTTIYSTFEFVFWLINNRLPKAPKGHCWKACATYSDPHIKHIWLGEYDKY